MGQLLPILLDHGVGLKRAALLGHEARHLQWASVGQGHGQQPGGGNGLLQPCLAWSHGPRVQPGLAQPHSPGVQLGLAQSHRPGV